MDQKLIEIESFANPQSRWHSRTLWIAIISFILFIAKTYFKFEIPHVDLAVNMLLNILVLVGVINNPENGNSL